MVSKDVVFLLIINNSVYYNEVDKGKTINEINFKVHNNHIYIKHTYNSITYNVFFINIRSIIM